MRAILKIGGEEGIGEEGKGQKDIINNKLMYMQYLDTCCTASRKKTSFISLEEFKLKSSKY